MNLNRKLKELRAGRGMTQENMAEYLGVSSQTVSKWERGLLSPDISLLPQIALLFQCSIDSLFDMKQTWSVEYRREFEAKIHELHAKQDWEGVYWAWIQEIERNPDEYGYYGAVMLHVYRRKLYDREKVMKMISLAEHAEKCCTDDDKRNEIYRVMLQLCSESEEPAIKEKGKYYYKKLPSLRHSREVYAKFVVEGEEYRTQILKNIIYEIDGAECGIRQLITPEMSPEEKLFYYQKAAALYEVVLDGKYAGFYDPPMLWNYAEMAIIYVQLGRMDEAAEMIHRIAETLERHTTKAREEKSKLLYTTRLPNAATPEQLVRSLFHKLLTTPELELFRETITAMQKKYEECQTHV